MSEQTSLHVLELVEQVRAAYGIDAWHSARVLYWAQLEDRLTPAEIARWQTMLLSADDDDREQLHRELRDAGHSKAFAYATTLGPRPG